MKQIAAALLCVGLCFYQVYRKKTLRKEGFSREEQTDSVASFVALIAALYVIFS